MADASTLVQLRTPGIGPSAPAEPVSGPVLVDPQARRVEYLRVSLSDRCNYRCTYCMPEEGVPHGARAAILSLEEVAQLCAAFARWGVRRVRLTGGEPTIRKGLVGLVEALTAIRTPEGTPLQVVMTTNGERLEALAAPLAKAGMGPVTVSVDSLDPARFARITRRGHLDRVVDGIRAASEAGLGPIKLNTVAIDGFNDDELGALARFAWDGGHVPRFIELMPMSGGDLYAPGELMSAVAIRERVARDVGGRVVPDDGAGVRGAGPATYHRIVGGPYDGHRFGTIAAMTENFCDGCNRLRVSALGQLQACLARDDAGDLRTPLRSGDPDALERAVRRVMGNKKDRHGFELDGSGGPRKAMVSIGG